MEKILGEIVISEGKHEIRISNAIERNEMEFSAKHLGKHLVHASIWNLVTAKKGRDSKFQSASEPLSGPEENVTTRLHLYLSNSNCTCGSKNPMTFKSSGLWKIDSLTYRTMVTSSCPNCDFSKNLIGVFNPESSV